MEINTVEFVLSTGLAIGVAAGVVNAMILGAFDQFARWRKRRKQVRFIRERIVELFTLIGNAKDLPSPAEGTEPISAYRIRFTYFEALLRELQVIASYRMTELDYVKVGEIQGELSGTNEIMKLLTGDTQRFPSSMNFYQGRYEQFVKMKWLNLPKEPPWAVKSALSIFEMVVNFASRTVALNRLRKKENGGR